MLTICKAEYEQRRRRLACLMEAGAVALIPAASEVLRNGDSHYRFRQDSNFYYLTGFEEPDALLVIIADDPPQSLLFNRPNDPVAEQWEGPRLGQKEAPAQLGVSEAYPIEEADVQLLRVLAERKTLYYPVGFYPAWEKRLAAVIAQLKDQLRRGVSAPTTQIDLLPLLSEMRLIKSEAEIALLRQAAAISATAHQNAMRLCRQLTNEGELDAELRYSFYRQGCRDVAYQPIVGSGAQSCILHYSANNRPLSPGGMVLIDAGGEYHNYAADISRSFPVNGRFSPEQRQVYEWVLNAQQAGIACIKPGVAWNRVQECMVRILTEGLCDMGILQGDVDELVAAAAYRPYYMHNSGHWLGLDVHDCGAYKQEGAWRLFEPGMVLTVEPGLYLAAHIPGLDARWHGIGVRIEDDILVTADGYDNLSAKAPVSVADIEALMCD
ncbi:MAG: Xaa-Pro aminopeptidase [Legionellaceae bacterium]|nr:Xaa-Pro aminopeptidase [Legionellaceae bacterium]